MESIDIADDQSSAVEGAERRIKSLSEIADAFKSVEAYSSDVIVPLVRQRQSGVLKGISSVPTKGKANQRRRD